MVYGFGQNWGGNMFGSGFALGILGWLWVLAVWLLPFVYVALGVLASTWLWRQLKK